MVIIQAIDMSSVQPLPGGVTHSYVLPGAAWEAPAQRGTVVDSIPFTHPAHVPALLELLRHQCTFNTLLSTCVASQHASTGRVSKNELKVDRIMSAMLPRKVEIFH